MSINTQRLNWQLGQQHLTLPAQVQKRDQSTVSFDIKRIEKAVAGCWSDFDTPPATPVEDVVNAVAKAIASRYGASTPTVEQIQDLVEITLLTLGEVEAARSYMAYRDAHAQQRTDVPAEIREVFDNSALYFPTQIQQFQFFDKYARFNWETMHRETWVETVDRVVDYLRWLVDERSNGSLDEQVYDRIRAFILDQKAMPSMRALAMAGEPAKRNSLAIYNCSYMPVKDPDVFVEALLISMAGCGVGFSVERQYVEQFPRIARQVGAPAHPFVVPDSTDGWAEALRFGLGCWFNGLDVEYDFRKVRKAGTPLLIKGGRASGPEPLKTMLAFVRETILKRQGSFLRTIDAHDMMCAVGQAAVAGGVRRTAMISLFSWDDHEMRDCKNGAWGTWPAIRENANNSAVWPDGLSQVEVVDQMMEMVRGKRGEPGIFSRENANRTKPQRRADAEFGTNPCGEINLRPFGLCNLTIAVARPEDTVEDLREKVEVATIIGTIQSLATEFPGMRQDWKTNCVEERLLGVDITGQRDCHLLNGRKADLVREHLRDHAVQTNQWCAAQLGINQSASVTCDKPSGNSSQLLNTSSGIHARWSPYYLRRTRVSATSALYRVLKAAGVPMTPENGQTEASATTWVIAWPMKAPEGAKTRKDFTAVDQCEYWLLNKVHWTEHNPSVTITYQPDEVLPMISWVWEHRDMIGGMAFLPADDAAYEQAPYEEITEDEYEQAMTDFPAAIDFSLLYAFEHSDMTTAAFEAACLAGNCDL
jgi:ribonucleoside-triphosphate reductase